ncbi:hypothetical protein ACLKA6_015910 [Drosophila palustris]
MGFAPVLRHFRLVGRRGVLLKSPVHIAHGITTVSRMSRRKLTPNFDVTEYQVLERKGNIVKVSGGGRILLRDVSHLKRIPGARTTMDIPSPATDLEKPDRRPPVESPGERHTSSGPGIKLKLINKGGMWEPVREGVESDALSHTGTDQSSPIGDRADERQLL